MGYKFLLVLGLMFTAGIFVFSPEIVLAQADTVAEVAGTAGLSDSNLMVIIGRIIGVLISLLGVVFLVLVIYAGYLWMTAGGDATKVEKAKKILINATIGLVITLFSFAIVNFVFYALTGAGLFSGRDYGTDAIYIESYSGSLGSGAIRDHYPERAATDVARNTKIFVTFRDAMDIESFIDGYDTNGTPDDVSDDTVATALRDRNIIIFPTAEGQAHAFDSSEVKVSFTDNLKTFVFSPPILGSSSEDVRYTVRLEDSIKNTDGVKVINDGGYEWFFTVGTELDLDPPTIKSVIPKKGGSYDRNIIVEINFDEAIDPTSSTGDYSASDPSKAFQNIRVVDASGNVVEGKYTLTNAYKTVTFITSDVCGVNSCGQTLTCLPGLADITATVYAATPGENPPQVDIFPYNGIVDVTGNALDGNNDGIAGDHYTWGFTTTNDINLSAPHIVAISPDILEEDVDFDQKVIVTFNGPMMTSTLTSDNITLASSPEYELWFSMFTDLIEVEEIETSQTTVRHGVFLESNDELTYYYSASVGDVRNQYQNCYYPAEGPGRMTDSCGTNPDEPYCCDGIPSENLCSLFD